MAAGIKINQCTVSTGLVWGSLRSQQGLGGMRKIQEDAVEVREERWGKEPCRGSPLTESHQGVGGLDQL